MQFYFGQSCLLQQMDFDLVIKKEHFLRIRSQPFEDFYLIHPKVIGVGSFGKVYKVREKLHPTCAWRAAKMYLKKNLTSSEQMLNELNILKRLDHPNIIKIYQVFENETKIYVVQDYYEGGELFEKLANHGEFSETEARRIFRQLLEAINYCHTHRICHRDLKPENILFLKKDSLELKVIDFGLAFEWTKTMRDELSLKSSKNVVGTAYYISPDILSNNNGYDERTDIWSLGIILYVLVTGIAPFEGETELEIFDKIAHYKYSLNIPEMKHVSPQLKDLIKKILVPANQRLTFQQIFQHTWMINEPNKIPIRINIKNLSCFSKFSKTKKLAAHCLASQISSIEVEQLTKMFNQIDINKDGEITFDEMKRSLEKEGMKYSDIKILMDSIDTDHNGKINYTQFLAGFSGEALFNEQNIQRAFGMLDRDGNGVVSKAELLSLFNQSGMNAYNGKAVQAIVEECDKDGNGVIDYEEFKTCLIKRV